MHSASISDIGISRQLIAGAVMRGFGQLPEEWKSKSRRGHTTWKLDVPSGEL